MKPLSSQHSILHYRQMTAVLALILSLVSFSAHAEELTDNTIRSFITTLEKAQALEPEFENLKDKGGIDSIDLSRIFSSSVEELKGEDVYDRLEDLVQDNGFNNLDEWAVTGDRIYGAWMAIEMGDESPELNQEMKSAMADLENNPSMSDQQKAQMRSMMEAALGVTQMASNVPPADIEAVRPHVNALKTITDNNED
ncbi:MAG: hypothetical protein ACTHWH_08915 [Marinobacter sp.]